ncbi:class I SAM-dependent methyltransferase [archaeon]|nr:MAG: class I SAM-dependent methyltransferase [archaeon]
MAAEKVGFYDWIASFEQLQPLLPVEGIEGRSNLKTLVIGCGTSLFAEKYAQHYGAYHAQIIAVDNDVGCIEHMKASFPNSAVEYERCDVLEEAAQLPGGAFHFVFDKGTFDAIHVEGSVAALLLAVNTWLIPQGLYVLVTLHPPALLGVLFGTEGLGLALDALLPLPHSSCHLAVVRRVGNYSVSLQGLQERERAVQDAHYKSPSCSLLTPPLLLQMQGAFGGAPEGRLSLEEVHALLFPPSLGYSLSMFRGDLGDFSDECERSLTYAEALAFVRQME